MFHQRPWALTSRGRVGLPHTKWESQSWIHRERYAMGTEGVDAVGYRLRSWMGPMVVTLHRVMQKLGPALDSVN